MGKKHWIYIKRGLSEDPKHRAAMGECVWLYMHIIDRADWEMGIAYDWKDSEEAAGMSLPLDTLRRQRQKLEELDYIRCVQKQHSQDVYIMEWRNPREYDSQVRNPRTRVVTDDHPAQGSNQGLNQGSNQVEAQVPTPTLDSISESSSVGGLSEKELAQANAKVDAIIENARHKSYANRDKIPEPYLPFADLYNQLTGQEATKRVINDWLMTFSEWQAEGLSVEHIRAAYQYATRPEGGFLVARPSSLTNTAVAMKTKALAKPPTPMVDTQAVSDTKKMLEEREINPSPMPDYVRAQIKAVVTKMEVK